MYQIGELILYGRTGVCRVEAINSVKLRGQAGEQLYYTLQPLYQSCSITTPVENPKVFSRPIITRAQAEELIEKIPRMDASPYHNRNLNQLREYYKNQMESLDCEDLILMTISIYKKKQEAIAQKRKFGAVDERFMKEAEDLLFGEFAAALDIDRQSVQSFIEEKVGKA
ncbi:MAG: CarD family transcriptional regulator [Oscillospiraceae bacterium]